MRRLCCVAGVIAPHDNAPSWFSKEISASAAIAILFHRARMLWIREHPCDSWLWGRAENPDSCGTTSQRPEPWRTFCIFRITVQKASDVSGWKRGQQRCAPNCSQMCCNRWTLQCFSTNIFSSKLPDLGDSGSVPGAGAPVRPCAVAPIAPVAPVAPVPSVAPVRQLRRLRPLSRLRPVRWLRPCAGGAGAWLFLFCVCVCVCFFCFLCVV